jgi:signal peptidase I
MIWDFSSILFFALLITGIIWATDAFFFAKRRAEVGLSGGAEDEPWLVDYARSFFPVILIVFLIRSFLAEPFRIPSGSMMPTLLVGDFILVNKFSYGVRMPVINKKVVEIGSPKRGDVVVFRYPMSPNTDYIKRVIGIPGDRIALQNKRLFINGQPVSHEFISSYEGVGSGVVMNGATLLNEDLQGVSHQILIQADRFSRSGEVVVPEGQYFVMGDNRDNSKDSRYWDYPNWGFVPDHYLVGKAFMIWMNWDDGLLQWERIGTSIQ